MDRIQLSQLRDIAIEYLPAAQQHREEIKARPTEDRESQHYARALWRIADETFARPEATAKELAAASLLNGITSYELCDPSDAAPATLYKARGIDTAPEKMRATMQQGIANAAKTLANVTGRDIPMVDPMAHCFDAPAVPATEQVDLSLAEVVRINEAAPLMGCTVESLLGQAANNERLLYVALKPHSQTLSVMPAWPNPMYPNPKLMTLSTKGVMFVAMMAHDAASLATFGSAEISQYQAGFEGVFDGHYWMLGAPQTVGLDRVYVPRSQLPATHGAPEKGEQVLTAADADTATAKVNNLLTKGQITAAFEDLHYNADQWSKYLASPPPWLVECRKVKGSKTASALWNPVEIAVALTDPKRGISVQKLDAVFVAHTFLKSWAEDWRNASEYLR